MVLLTILKKKVWYYYPCNSYRSGIVIFSHPVHYVSPQMYDLFISSFFAFFGQPAVTNTVQEARGWTPALAWMTFNYGLILMVGGALVMLYNNVKDEHPHQIFALVWSLIMLFSTWQHVRYEYYLAVNVALLSAVCISFTFERGWPDIHRLTSSISSDTETRKTTREKRSPHKAKNRKNSRRKDLDPLNPIILPLHWLFSPLDSVFCLLIPLLHSVIQMQRATPYE